MEKMRHLLCLAAGASTLALAGQAFAQDSAVTTGGETRKAAAQGETGFSDIVVIARRREEAAQSVPLSITALSGNALEQKGVQSVDQLRDVAPGVNVGAQKRDEAQFYIRGQGPGVINSGQRNFSSVATYFAEVPIPVAGPGVFFDLQSVQVLKGPQGTLFGRNTTGGAVLFEPNRPKDYVEGMMRVTGGNYDRKMFEGVVNVPFGNDLGGIRASGQIERRDGFTKNIMTGQKLDGRKYESARVSVLLRPAAGLENLLIVDYLNRHQSGSSAVLRGLNNDAAISPNALSSVPGAPAVPLILGQGAGRPSIGCLSDPSGAGCPPGGFPGIVGAAIAAGGFGLFPNALLDGIVAQQKALGIRKVSYPGLFYTNAESFGVTNKTTWQINDKITLKNIIAYRTQRSDEGNDYDGTALPLIAQFNTVGHQWQGGQDQFTEELQIQGRLSDAFNFILGGYHEKSTPGVKPGIPANTFGQLVIREVNNNDKSDALFAHAEYNITERIQISGGFRRTWDTRKASLTNIDSTTGACILVDPQTITAANPNGSFRCPIKYKAKFHASTYDATLQWKPTDKILLYGAYRRGFKSGGFNLPAPTPDTQSFKPETVDDFEIGLKADWDIGVPFRTNISAFYDKFKDVQVTVPVAIANAGIASVARNLGRQTNKGFEVESYIIPVRNLTISGFLSYLKATSDITLPFTPAIKGRQAVYQPHWKYSVSGRYVVPLDDGGEIALQADYSYQSQTNSPDFAAPPPLNTFPGFGIANARVEWSRIRGSQFDVAAFVNNLTNKAYITGGYPLYSQIGFDTVIYGEPRMYGASLTFHWGKR